MCENVNDRDRKVHHFNYRIFIINNLSYLYRKVDPTSLNIGKKKKRAMRENRSTVKNLFTGIDRYYSKSAKILFALLIGSRFSKAKTADINVFA